ncbi:MAG: universal stress protein [Myxococcota bacterium]
MTKTATETKPKWTYVVGLDFSECGTRALRQTLERARHESAVVHVAHAVTRSDLGAGAKIEQQDEALDRVPRKMWRTVFHTLQELKMGYDEVPMWLHVRFGTPLEVIRQVTVDYDADLVVVGTHGRDGVKRLILGSVAEALVRDGRFPVLIAHENRISELGKTLRPEPPRAEETPPPEEALRRHGYRSTLISAWNAFGRPTSPSL